MADSGTVEVDASELLASTSTDGLLRAAYALTHRIHEATGVSAPCRVCGRGRAAHARGGSNDDCPGNPTSLAKDLRAQRDLITAEILSRTAH